jgi:hypothetical protein
MRLAGLIVVALFVCTSLFAQGRTFVSSTGLDTNPCSRTAPCRSFGTAVTVSIAGGEVIVLDSAGYGPVSIDKSISLIAPAGVHAGITAPIGSNFGVYMNASLATINLVGLSINCAGGTDGIEMDDVAELHIERALVNGFDDGAAVSIFPNSGRFTNRDSELRASHWGVLMSNNAEGSIDHTRFDDNFLGVEIDDVGKLTVRDSVFFSGEWGLFMDSIAAHNEWNVVNYGFSSATYGIFVQSTNQDADATARFSESTFVNHRSNALTHTAGNGTWNPVSFGNNQFHGNNVDGTFDTTIALK